ncbi:MAG: NADH-quinone oxidoreductase subunit L [Candidatus Nitrosocaldaceae archaeon]|nr:MAG: NADH-quinone oxidoreductase subunit L [Candidatus Nitrosocaldaceae archaeon]
MLPIDFIFRAIEGSSEVAEVITHNPAFDGLAMNVWLIWIIPMIGAMLSPLFHKISPKVRDTAPAVFAFASAVLASTLIPVMLEGDEVHTQIPWIKAIGINAGLLADTLSIIISNLVAWISFLIIVYSKGYMKGDPDLMRYWFFMLFFIGSMQLIVLSDNFLMLFFGWEGVGLASYALIGFWYRDRAKDYVGRVGHYALGIPQFTAPTHAGMKAFLMTKAGDIFMLIGIFLIFMHAGTFEYKPLIEDHTWAETMHANGLLIPAAVLIFGGAVGKSAQFPLHEWLLEAMTGPTAVSALIHAATMVKAGVYLVARVGPIFFVAAEAASMPFFEVVAWIGALTAFILASQAIVNKEIKKVLAYSTGSQIGYMMLALGIAGLSASFVEGYAAGIFHLASHAMFKASLFMIAGGLLHVAESRFMDDMGGLKQHMRKSYIAMMAAGLSLAGAPIITSGFWSKDAIFAALLDSNYALAPALYALAVIVAVMTAFYTMRMVGMAMFGNKSQHLRKLEEHGHHVHEVSALMWVPFSILAAGTIIVGISGPFVEGFIHERLGEFLTNTYHIEVPHEAEEGISLNMTAVASSLVSFGIGAGLGYIYYIKRAADPTVISRNAFTRGIYKFLENRWYINSIYYWLFVIGPLFIARIFWKYFESVAVEGINPALQFSMAWWSKIVRYMQSGVVQTYVYAFGIGLVFVLIILLAA